MSLWNCGHLDYLQLSVVCVCVCVCVFRSLPVKEIGRERVHCTMSQ